MKTTVSSSATTVVPVTSDDDKNKMNNNTNNDDIDDTTKTEITNDNDDDDDDDKKTKYEERGPLATISEVFSFAQTTRVKIYIICGFSFAIVSGCVKPAMAWLLASSFEDLTAPTSNDAFLNAIREVAFYFMGLGVVAFIFMTLQSACMECAATEMSQTLKQQWFEAIVRQDMAYFDLLDVSGTASIISINGAKYKKGVGRKLAEGMQHGITFIGSLIYGFWSSWQVSLLVLVVTPFMAASCAFLLKMNQSQSSRANESYANAGSVVYTSVSSIRTVLSLNGVESMIKKFEIATTDAYDGASSQVIWIGLSSGCVMGSFLLAYIPVTLYGAYLLYENVKSTGCDPSGSYIINETCTPGATGIFGALIGITFAGAVLPQVATTLEVFTAARAACYPALVAINRKIDDNNNNNNEDNDQNNNEDNNEDNNDLDLRVQALKQRRRSSSTTRTLMNLPKYLIDSSSTFGINKDNVNGKIQFYNVTFSYPTRLEIPVLKKFTLTINSGKTVALVGSSGSGKSTIVHLIERFYDPQYGSIVLDNTNIKELNVNWLRQQIGLVSQEPKLFATSIGENIALGYPGNTKPTQEQIEQAARKANAHDFIVSFPEGYNTQVGDQGAQLSGGQKQRIAIARVLIKKPKLIVLDEATSALDSESEAVVQEALDKLIEEGKQTILVIAHRLSTVRNADKIVVMDKGEVLETGAHDELLARKSAYYDLIEAQKGIKKNLGRGDTFNSFTSNNSENNYEELELSSIDGSNNNNDNNESEERTIITANGLVVSFNPVKQCTLTSPNDSSYKMDAACQTSLVPPGTPVLRFNNVHFHYPSRPLNKVFRGLDLEVKEGETLAIVGPSGQGKSTIIQLIENFYHPTSGSIEYYGFDMKDLNVRWLRSKFGLVSQEPYLFDDTISENIRFGFSEYTQEQVELAAKQANAHNFIMEFPDGYDTRVGSSGSSQVSGGQKQRIAIARALLRRPKVLLLDEATSALDSESEQIVQQALDNIMSDDNQTTIVIAHRLSTIRDADRIAVIDHGKVREIGTHDELMAKKGGKYRRLHDYQNLDVNTERKELVKKDKKADQDNTASKPDDSTQATDEEDEESEKKHAQQARLLARGDEVYFAIGGCGAILAGLMFPGWGFVFAYLIQLLYTPVQPCDDIDFLPPFGFSSCPEYWNFLADDMRALSFKVFYGLLGIVASAICGHVLLFYGFGTATERMNKRVRDAAFKNLLRQEVAWFDVRPVGTITTKLSDDAALIHSFSGEPIRSLTLSLASVLVGLVVSFYYMWPFALLTIGTMPFMAFGAYTEMQMVMGEDEGDMDKEDKSNTAGAIVVETLQNIRTVASMTIEQKMVKEYAEALGLEFPHPLKTNAIKGSASGLGQFVLMWGIAVMFWWGGFLLFRYPDTYTFRDFMISMFSLLFSVNGMGFAAQGATDRGQAKAAAARIFDLIYRKSLIDPLSDEGRTDIED